MPKKMTNQQAVKKIYKKSISSFTKGGIFIQEESLYLGWDYLLGGWVGNLVKKIL